MRGLANEGTVARVGLMAVLPCAGNTNTSGLSPSSVSLGHLEGQVCVSPKKTEQDLADFASSKGRGRSWAGSGEVLRKESDGQGGAAALSCSGKSECSG